MNPTVRINRFLARAGFGSRRRCEELIRRGAVTVDGKRIESLSLMIDPERDRVSVDGTPVEGVDAPVILVLNKPAGVISSVSDGFGRTTVIDLARQLGYRQRLFPVGRLDLDTTGILLLTNDGETANRLMHPRYKVEKTYRVTVRGAVAPETVRSIAAGVTRADFVSGPCRVTVIGPRDDGTELEVILREGKKRQVRRLFELHGHTVVTLHRSAIGDLTFDDLAPGAIRPLTAAERTKLGALVGLP